MGDLSKNFSRSEFRCPCGCGGEAVSMDLIERLQEARELAQVAFSPTSGYRCPAHNAEVGGKPNSAHLSGEAVDLKIADNYVRFRILEAAVTVGFKRIGIGSDFLHLDVSDWTLPAPRVWVYK